MRSNLHTKPLTAKRRHRFSGQKLAVTGFDQFDGVLSVHASSSGRSSCRHGSWPEVVSTLSKIGALTIDVIDGAVKPAANPDDGRARASSAGGNDRAPSARRARHRAGSLSNHLQASATVESSRSRGRLALRAGPSCRTTSAVADVAVCVTAPGCMNAVEEVRDYTSSV